RDQRKHDASRSVFESARQPGGHSLEARRVQLFAPVRRTAHYFVWHRRPSEKRIIHCVLPACCRPDPAAVGLLPIASKSQSSTWDTRPSASLGSNQVDFGGMTSPRSATAIRSSMPVG